ncbi:MAG: hypothetical protein R8L07_03395 [Alphaproteobacteria bacterium]|nr:hypothetical protein [Alphaproteobacteria bacterium]
MVEQVGFAVTIEAHLDRFDREMRDAGRVVETTAAGMDRSTKRAARSFDALEAALDPVARATRRYERDVERVKRALDSGAVSQERAANVLQRLHQQYTRATTVNDNFGAATGRTAIMSGRMGNAVQQAGFQVGDFAVQVSSGQNPLRAFIQQGTQMISMFGPWGAVIGAGGAVIGALAMSFIGANDEVEKTTDSIDEFSLATENMARLVGGGEQSLDGLTEAYRRLSMAQRDVERTALATQRDTFESQLESAARASRSTIGGILPTALGSYQEEFREAREALLQIKDVARDRAQIVENVRAAIEALREAGRIEEAQQLLTNLRDFEKASQALDHIDGRMATLSRSAQGLIIPENSLLSGNRSAANDLYFQDVQANVDATRDRIAKLKEDIVDLDAEWDRVRNIMASTQGQNSLTTGEASAASQAVFDRANAQAAAVLERREAAQKELNRQTAIANNLLAQSVTPMEQHRDALEAIAAAEAAGTITTEQATAARLQAMNVFMESDPVLSSVQSGLRDVGRSMIDLGDDAGSMGDRVAAAFERMAERILQAAFELEVVNPIINSLFGAGYQTSSGFGGGFGGGGGGGIFGSLIGAAASFFGGGGYTTTSVGTIHSGGLAGGARGITRDVSPAVFFGAGRYHDGGIPGLRGNEVPAILEDDEEVLTVRDPRHRFNLGMPANDRASGPVFNIDARGADREGMARLEATIRELNGRINQVDRSIEARAVEANVSARQREPGLFGRVR